MSAHFKENIAVMGLAFAMLAVTLIFLRSGYLLSSGAGFGLAALFIAKGSSRLRCHLSDVGLSVVVLGLLSCSKIVPPSIANPLIFEVAAIAVSILFAATGLTFKAIAADQKARRQT